MSSSLVVALLLVFYFIGYLIWTSRSKEAAEKRNQKLKEEFKGENKYGLLIAFLFAVPFIICIGVLWFITE
ncbi:hypothetical protein [Domibacillus tundrae]|uniref:hypothetical protein n=1 Tax=Domibacillus tundrae TaxID=1587527 RepID=UPI000617B0C1|nr:hypothetical protein [Domibacillus tundrae]